MTARVVRGKFEGGKFVQDSEGRLYAVFNDDKMVTVQPSPDDAARVVEEFEAADRRAAVAKARETSAEEEAEERKLQQRGVVVFQPTQQESKTALEISRLASLAKVISKTEVAFKVFREGKPEIVTEPIGQYDDILRSLLFQRGSNGAGATR